MAKCVEFPTYDQEMVVGSFESDWQFDVVSLSNIIAQIFQEMSHHQQIRPGITLAQDNVVRKCPHINLRPRNTTAQNNKVKKRHIINLYDHEILQRKIIRSENVT